MWGGESCRGCHFNLPKDYPQLKFRQEVGYPALANQGYLCRKDVTSSAKVVDKFNKTFPKISDQSCTRKPVAKILSEDLASDHVSARRVHSPSTSNPPLNSSVPSAPIEKNLLLLPNQSWPMPTSNGYADIYSSESEDDPVLKEIIINDKTVNSINM